MPVDLGPEAIVSSCQVGAGVMRLVRDGLGGGPSGGEVPVAEGAERLAQTLLRGIKSFVDQRPSTHPADLSSASIKRSKKILT